jgi:hypothetical protein
MENTEHPTTNFHHRTARQSHHRSKAESRKQKVEKEAGNRAKPGKATQSHPKATLRLPSGHLVANR